MEFLKNFLINLIDLFRPGLFILLFYPVLVRMTFEVFSASFGPIAYLVVIVAALPRIRRSGRREALT